MFIIRTHCHQNWMHDCGIPVIYKPCTLWDEEPLFVKATVTMFNLPTCMCVAIATTKCLQTSYLVSIIKSLLVTCTMLQQFWLQEWSTLTAVIQFCTEPLAGNHLENSTIYTFALWLYRVVKEQLHISHWVVVVQGLCFTLAMGWWWFKSLC